MTPIVKICGLKTPETLEAALEAGADMVGFVFFPPSPRFVTPGAAAPLARAAAGRALRVALVVDADDDSIAAITGAADVDILQLHGRETPERVAAVKARFGLPVMKALGVASEADCAHAAAYAEVADRLLLDAKPPKGAALPGGNGVTFDWMLLRALRWDKPWLLSGGLDASNVGQALRQTGAPGVDVSSGVESAPGVKDIAKIKAFVRAAKSL